MAYITRLIVLILVGASLATGTSPAVAGVAPTPNQGLHDIVYVEKEKDVPSGARTSLSVFCPSGRPVITGGIHITGTDLSIEVGSTGPVDSRRDDDRIPDDGWRAAANNDSGGMEKMTVRAQCAHQVTRKILTYRSGSNRVPADTWRAATAWCPVGYSPIGGGVSTSGASTRVMVIGDRPWQPGLWAAWTAMVDNESAKPIPMKAHAVCVDKDHTGDLSYPSASALVPGQTQRSLSVPCPGGMETFGGGAEVFESNGNIASLEMVEDMYGAAAGWLAWFNNRAQTHQASVEVWAICWSD